MASHNISQEIQDDVLSCAICNNHLTEPKALPCLHTYCCKCLQELATSRRTGAWFRCPECRKVVEVPIGGVQAFPTNFLVANVLEKVQQCKEEKQKQADETDMCDVHKQEAQVVCDTCNVVVCNVCLKSGHKEHVLKHIDQEKAKKKKQLEKLIKETTDVSGDLSHVKLRLQEKHKEVRRRIESRAAVVIHKVECQKKRLLEEIDKQKERKLEKIVRIERQHSGQKRKMAAKLSAVKAIRNNNKQLLYKNILSHISCLTAAKSETSEYQAKQAAPLLGEVSRLKFVPSSLDQPLLGHIDEGSDGPSGSNPKPSSSGTSGNVAKAAIRGSVPVNPLLAMNGIT
ncbi:TRIM59 [Branchiostoma lanceolatum]|uniref:TRIM59 protein n=1 Tax=Branchiostoma lanceolatum TaxID=7740 RepID=A0A8J9ZCU5_BRALA|nr:TRIM59 [Branchiostoma lanceolatum]